MIGLIVNTCEWEKALWKRVIDNISKISNTKIIKPE